MQARTVHLLFLFTPWATPSCGPNGEHAAPSAAMSVADSATELTPPANASLAVQTPTVTASPASQAEPTSFTASTLLLLPEPGGIYTQVKMCWRPSAYAEGELKALFAEGRATVEAAVQESWVRNSWVRVTWAPHCDAGGIPVEIADRRSSADQRGMVLNFTFANYIPDCAPTSHTLSNPTWSFCVRSLSVHEFGHVLGFDHEQNRSKDGIVCGDGSVRPPDEGNFLIESDMFVGPEDPASVMSYCNEGFTDTLSKGDVDALGALYGADERYIESGRSYVLRLDTRFADVVDAEAPATLGTSDEIAESFVIERVDGAGPVRYGDEVRLGYESRPLCSAGACTWTVSSAQGSTAGELVRVNEPVQLIGATPTGAGAVDGAIATRDAVLATRLLGPFD
jgi:hypothetical protein